VIDVISFGLFSGLIGGLKGEPIAETIYPGQILFFSARNSLLVFMLFWLSITLLFGLSTALFFGLSLALIDDFIIGMKFGLGVGLIFGLVSGGLAVIQHYILRLSIALQRLFPWRLIPFLEYASDRIFLYRVGSGYIFIHRSFMDHFAEMEIESL
jgi:hypothetical protein